MKDVFRRKHKEKKKRKYRAKHPHSLRFKLSMMLIGITGGITFAGWFLSVIFLTDYYEDTKIDMLESIYRKSDKLMLQEMNEKITEAERNLQFEIMGANAGIDVYVFDLMHVLGTMNVSFVYPEISTMNSVQLEDFKSKISEYIMGQETEAGEHQKKLLLHSRDNYDIYKVYDKRIGSLYIELIGSSESGSYIYVRANYESMQESIVVISRFLRSVLLGVGLFGVCIIMIFTNNFVHPILELSDIAQKMSRLELGVRYTDVQRADEIGILGRSFNSMAKQLEKTISELKQANNRLQNDIEKRAQIDEMRKEFLSNVSHELKTPLALIQGYAEGLSENINDDVESREFYCDVIIDEAGKMNQMVKKILSLNQLEFGDNPLEYARFNVADVISSVLQTSGILAEQKGASIIFEQYHPVYVWADEFMVEEVINNYVSNAIHYVEEGGVVNVALREREECVRICVYNSGSHIPEDEIDKVWQKFYKVDKARTREYGGSGIGLSIVKAIMESMNQEYGVKNHQEGVEFWFELESAK